MYTILQTYLNDCQIIALALLATFGITFLVLKFPPSFLPRDQGREFAVNGDLSKGKVRGVGLLLVLCLILSALLFLPFQWEFAIYWLLLVCSMLSGYLDDGADIPWSEAKKGLLDLVISAVTVFTFLNFNDTAVSFLGWELILPKWLYFLLGILLLWVSINVTNCTDGVDGLCASLGCVTLVSFRLLFGETLETMGGAAMLFTAVLLAYLYFNLSPSSMLMGDAGSRALGFFLALTALKSRHPFAFLLLAAVLIWDGGAGLVKVFLKRYCKIQVLVHTRTPLHDHMRKNRGWSDTQVVGRFLLVQLLLSLLCALLVK